MLFTWEPEYDIQVEMIDTQHRRMVDMINEYYKVLTERRGTIDIGGFLGGLVEYAQNHFADEERLMRESGYPGIEAHLAEHEKLRGKVLELEDETAGFGKALSMRLAVFLREWLMKHILTSDMEFGKFLKGNGECRSPFHCDTCSPPGE